MALWHCCACTAAYAVGARACPQCGSTDYMEDEPMPKVTAHGGASNAADERGEESSPGSSSSTSSEKDDSSPKTSEPAAPLPVRKTASRSKQDRTDSSSAPPTDGGPTEATSKSDD